MDNTGIYIPSIDAKDIYLSAHYIEENPEGYNLKLKDGQYNLRKFINTLDYSLDLIELKDIISHLSIPLKNGILKRNT